MMAPPNASARVGCLEVVGDTNHYLFEDSETMTKEVAREDVTARGR